MISPKLYRSSRTYDFFMKLLGYESSIDRYLRGLDLELTAPQILDAGCGTGCLGLHFLERFPGSRLVATDLEPNFLTATLANADRRNLARSRISVGVANISTPQDLTTLDGQPSTLAPASFDLICIGAVVGYAADIERSLQQLVQLLKPNGYFINLEMNESPTGRFVSHRYHYANIRLARMHQVLRDTGCDVTAQKLKLRHLPAKFTRTAIVARKSPSAPLLPVKV